MEKKPKIKVYSTSSCPYCVYAKAYLKELGYEFEDVNVGSDQKAAMEMVAKSGQMGVPVIEINGKIIIGFDKAGILKALGK